LDDMTTTLTQPATQSSNPDRKVPTRRISFEEALRDLPKHFAVDGDLVSSHVASALSSLFPDGEDFFVRSVRHYRDDISDPELKRQVSGFIGQEAVHGREHRVLNERLAELGYPTKGFEELTAKGLALRSRFAPPIANLAATAALEHFTATLAELVLTSEETREQFGPNAVQEVFTWHALEESEHKAVAFDVYKAVGGSERVRVWTMRVLRYGFVGGVVAQVAFSLGLEKVRDRKAWTFRELRASLKRFRKSPVLDRRIWQQLKDYDRSTFHPDDSDTDALVEEWRAVLFGTEGTLNSKLAGATA
jgi:predicted metal-dependent hydrolase